jgi:pimeloyl-ACP methyl ester carboxylesterase
VIARALGAAMAITLLAAPLALAADDYTDPAYLQFDAENMSRTLQRQAYHFTTPEYWLASADTFPESWLAGWQRQVRDAPEGRAYVTGGSVLPGGNVGDPEHYRDGERTEVEFLDRDGARLIGNVWPCSTGGACPGVVITTGSIQVTQHMYGWLARTLQLHGYTVFTFDVRGQGQSESTTKNPQDQSNFVNGTIDALHYFLSDANPLRARVDGRRLALVGHSLGASAVSIVQQCSSAYRGTDATACGGETWPIRAVVAYDALATGVKPVVPAFDHRADGYFINAVPTPTAPDPDERVNGAYKAWRDAGVDACTITVRGGTHAEWSEIPYIVSATRYGNLQSAYYTLAFLDTYVRKDKAGLAALKAGPIPAEPAGSHQPWRASLFSGKYRSACHVRDFDAPDLRAYAGVAAVGDWAGLNAETERSLSSTG